MELPEGQKATIEAAITESCKVYRATRDEVCDLEAERAVLVAKINMVQDRLRELDEAVNKPLEEIAKVLKSLVK